MKTTKRIEVNTYAQAWEVVQEINAGDYIRISDFTDYPMYRNEADGSWVSDLNTRLELNLANGKSINIWFSDLAMKLIEKDAEIAKLYKEIERLNKLNKQLAEKCDELNQDCTEFSSRITGYETLLHEVASVVDALKKFA